MGVGDRVERGAHVGKDRHASSCVHVDVHEHLLRGGEQSLIVVAKHLVVDVQALAVDSEDPRGDAKRGTLGRLAQIRDLRFGCVEAVPRGAVRIVVADVGEQRVTGPTDGRQVGGLGHVVVVIDPRW